MLRRLRIAASVFFAALMVLLCVMWVRSYWRDDFFGHIRPYTNRAAERRNVCQLVRGRVVVASYDQEVLHSGDPGFFYETVPAASYGDWNAIPRCRLRFEAPIGLAIAAIVVLAVAPWFPWSSRYSIRTLLIATTLAAVLLGLAIWLSS